MTLQASGAISLANIQTEFGGANPISLSEYYRGGTYVPSGASASIPTSGAIKLSDFYGASAAIITIGDHTITGTGYTETNPSPPPAVIRNAAWGLYALNSAGTSAYQQSEDGGGSTSANYSGEWLGAGLTASDYEVQVVVTGTGTMSGSTTGAGVWNSLGTNRSWTSTTVYLSLPATQTLTVTIRRISDSVTMDTAVITIDKVAV